jgi:hypothetical protein
MYIVVAIEDGREKPISTWSSYALANNECDDLEKAGFRVFIEFKDK